MKQRYKEFAETQNFRNNSAFRLNPNNTIEANEMSELFALVGLTSI